LNLIEDCGFDNRKLGGPFCKNDRAKGYGLISAVDLKMDGQNKGGEEKAAGMNSAGMVAAMAGGDELAGVHQDGVAECF